MECISIRRHWKWFSQCVAFLWWICFQFQNCQCEQWMLSALKRGEANMFTSLLVHSFFGSFSSAYTETSSWGAPQNNLYHISPINTLSSCIQHVMGNVYIILMTRFLIAILPCKVHEVSLSSSELSRGFWVPDPDIKNWGWKELNSTDADFYSAILTIVVCCSITTKGTLRIRGKRDHLSHHGADMLIII